MTTDEIYSRITEFLDSIGIQYAFGQVPPEKEFLNGICIDNGRLLIDKDRLKHPGDILHEAGHLAVAAPSDRVKMDGKLNSHRDQDKSEEMMAIAWSYAATVHLNIDPHVVFHSEGYKNEAETIVQNFQQGHFFAVSMLQWTGMAYETKRAAEINSKPYPYMQRWIREFEVPTE